MTPRAHIVVDYQNIHLTGHNLWCPEGEAKHLCLVHPLHFAHQVLQQRNLLRRLLAEREGAEFTPAKLEHVIAFRGQPSNRHEPTAYRRSQAQRSEWTRDPKSKVHYRPLKYYDGGRAQEKGVDVLVALELVKMAAKVSRTPGDLVILAAHDTDQEPALEMAMQLAPDQVETTGWKNARVLRVPTGKPWHTALHEEHFERSRDLKDYR